MVYRYIALKIKLCRLKIKIANRLKDNIDKSVVNIGVICIKHNIFTAKEVREALYKEGKK